MLDASAMLLPTPPKAVCTGLHALGTQTIAEARLLQASSTRETLRLSVWSTTCERPHPRSVARTTRHRVSSAPELGISYATTGQSSRTTWTLLPPQVCQSASRRRLGAVSALTPPPSAPSAVHARMPPTPSQTAESMRLSRAPRRRRGEGSSDGADLSWNAYVCYLRRERKWRENRPSPIQANRSICIA